jgi:hypothetical protein
MRCWLVAIIVGVAIPTAAITTVQAVEIENTKFHDRLQVGDTLLDVRNVAVFRYRLVFKPFVAALYLERNTPTAQVLADIPKRLEIEYYYAINGREIAAASDKILAENLTADQLSALRPRLERIRGLYQDVRPGDRYSLTYIPNYGTLLSLNERALGVVEGADFATAYFTIWLGKSPMDNALRDQLLRP